jgi:ribosomal-protein-serine acetyltransferase
MHLPTRHPEVILRSLGPADAPAYTAVLRANAGHLTRLGDFTHEVGRTEDHYAALFASPGDPLWFGIYESGRLSGSVTLVAVDPPKFGLGYWLTEAACGRGLATLAIEALMSYARSDLGATDLFAGVTHGNARSVAVLERLSFERVATFDTYDRYHHGLAGTT